MITNPMIMPHIVNHIQRSTCWRCSSFMSERDTDVKMAMAPAIQFIEFFGYSSGI